MTYEIRAVRPEDLDALAEVAEGVGLFPGSLLAGMVAGSPEGIWLAGLDGAPQGFCFAEAEAFTEGVWNMRALGVAPGAQGRGLGSALTQALEAALAGARLLIVETSGGPDFAPARGFYAARGYRETARIEDYWAPGEAKVIFTKAL